MALDHMGIVVSPATRPTDAAVLAAWRERLAGRVPAPDSTSETVSEQAPAAQ
ncbi:hypothetical protein [Streptomyces sp. NPDC096105]|uniref:hypothetical protein n=1 Tax=Streptomyces sp. NPDC096105 TaxID=3366074 RepID=UPI0038208899